jgi:hypothetical protein
MVPRVRLAGHAYTPHLPPIRLLRTLLTSFLPRKPPSNTRPSKERSTLARYPSSGGPSSCIIWAMASSHELGILELGFRGPERRMLPQSYPRVASHLAPSPPRFAHQRALPFLSHRRHLPCVNCQSFGFRFPKVPVPAPFPLPIANGTLVKRPPAPTHDSLNSASSTRILLSIN